MARKEARITIDFKGAYPRDNGKVFHLLEMPTTQGEDWAVRFFIALAKAGTSIPPEIAAAGLAGVASLGPRGFSGLRHEDAKPLMDELMACVSIVPDPKTPQVQRPLIDDDIEEVATRLYLKAQVFELHTGFSVVDVLSPSAPPSTVPNSAISPSTPTSPGPSAP